MLIASAGADVDRALLKIIKNYISCYHDFPFPRKSKLGILLLKIQNHNRMSLRL